LGGLPKQSPPENRPISRDTPRIAQRLALTHDQLIQFHAINHDRKTQLGAVQSDPSLSPHARHQKIKEIHAVAEAKLRGLLNQNQLDEYDQIKRERMEQRKLKRDTITAPEESIPPQ
jgi:hypothetical protein